MTISGKKNCKENILYLHWYQMKHDGCVICRKPEKRCITLRAQVISILNWQQEETSHWKIPIYSTIQVHLANDDPISALDDAVAVLKIQSDDFTALCIKVTRVTKSENFPDSKIFVAKTFRIKRVNRVNFQIRDKCALKVVLQDNPATFSRWSGHF